MPTLHIEHAITDFPTWRAAFDRAEPYRVAAGVRRHAVRRPVDDPKFVVIDLDFDDVAAAQAFLHFLRTSIWATPASSPALAGEPDTLILEPAVG